MRRLEKGVSDELIGMMEIPGMGPKTLAMIHKEKGIGNLSQLEKAVEDGSLIGLPGMGEKKAENIKRGIELLKAEQRTDESGNSLSIGQNGLLKH